MWSSVYDGETAAPNDAVTETEIPNETVAGTVTPDETVAGTEDGMLGPRFIADERIHGSAGNERLRL